jgi:DNA-binding MarR family transcriptional regulator
LISTDTFIAMWSIWLDLVPASLAKENPDILLRLLRLADVSTGVSQATLQRALKLNQSKLSKLTAKLIKYRWLVLQPEAEDRRFLFVRTSPLARGLITALETRLSKLLPLVRKTSRPRRSQYPNALGSLLDGLPGQH